MRTTAEIIKGTSKTLFYDAVDDYGQPRILTGAVLELLVQEAPDSEEAVIEWLSTDTEQLRAAGQRVTVNFLPGDTEAVDLGAYVFQIKATMPDGNVYIVIEWSTFFVSLGGTASPTTDPFATTVMVNHNYGTPDALRYLTPGADGIEDASIRIYRKADYDVNILESPVAISTTDADGRWRAPTLLPSGMTYVVYFFKVNEFGPDTVEIVV